MRSTKGLIWRNLTAHPLRSILTALAITLGVAMVLAATVIGQAANQQATAVSTQTLPIDLEIAARDNAPFAAPLLASHFIQSTLPQLHITPKIQPSGRKLEIIGTDLPLYADIYRPELANGRFPPAPNAIILPMSVALQNSLNVGDEIELADNGRRQTFIVAGRLKLETDPLNRQSATAFIPLAAAQELANLSNQVDHIDVMLAADTNLDDAKSGLSQQLGSDLIVTRTAVPGSANFNLIIIQAGMGIIGLIILFAASFVILNAFAMAVTARIEEIGALRALGMKRRQILRQVLGEALFLALIGSVLGILLG
ncbi:MAG: FtsX-like permease family protein, partial [Chloroflexi bacterium]|nr:FtsX-like permease family protein [Chloroflexota bacterium]